MFAMLKMLSLLDNLLILVFLKDALFFLKDFFSSLANEVEFFSPPAEESKSNNQLALLQLCILTVSQLMAIFDFFFPQLFVLRQRKSPPQRSPAASPNRLLAARTQPQLFQFLLRGRSASIVSQRRAGRKQMMA